MILGPFQAFNKQTMFVVEFTFVLALTKPSEMTTRFTLSALN